MQKVFTRKEVALKLIDLIEQDCLKANHSGTGWACEKCSDRITDIWIKADGIVARNLAYDN